MLWKYEMKMIGLRKIWNKSDRSLENYTKMKGVNWKYEIKVIGLRKIWYKVQAQNI